MEQWVPFRNGEYLVENAFLLGQDDDAVPVEQAVMEVYTGADGLRQIKGFGRVRNVRVVDLLEDTDDIDLLLDLGDDLRFRLAGPDLKAGKVFDPEVKSLIQFTPTAPWVAVSPEEFSALKDRWRLLE